MNVTIYGTDEKVHAVLARLETLMKTGDRLVMSIMFSSVQRIGRTVERTEKTTERTTEKAVDVMVSSMEDKERKKVEAQERKLVDASLKAPALAEVRKLYAQFAADRLKGSGEWIREEGRFRS